MNPFTHSHFSGRPNHHGESWNVCYSWLSKLFGGGSSASSVDTTKSALAQQIADMIKANKPTSDAVNTEVASGMDNVYSLLKNTDFSNSAINHYAVPDAPTYTSGSDTKITPAEIDTTVQSAPTYSSPASLMSALEKAINSVPDADTVGKEVEDAYSATGKRNILDTYNSITRDTKSDLARRGLLGDSSQDASDAAALDLYLTTAGDQLAAEGVTKRQDAERSARQELLSAIGSVEGVNSQELENALAAWNAAVNETTTNADLAAKQQGLEESAAKTNSELSTQDLANAISAYGSQLKGTTTQAGLDAQTLNNYLTALSTAGGYAESKDTISQLMSLLSAIGSGTSSNSNSIWSSLIDAIGTYAAAV